jgi:hypothetical protein
VVLLNILDFKLGFTAEEFITCIRSNLCSFLFSQLVFPIDRPSAIICACK